jgi:chemotaxis protein methyltransferase CheR
LTPAEFDVLSDLANRRCGIQLHARKSEMIEARLVPVASRFGFSGLDGLFRELRRAPETLAAAVVEALLIKDTAFFRDTSVFAHFRENILPALLTTRAGDLRIWCAGCSTGQEAYSLAMILEEQNLANAGWHVDLIATDLSEDAVARAKEGVYSDYEVSRGLSAAMLNRHFVQVNDAWRANERLRRMVQFRTFNLLDDYGWLGRLDAIFCRNVLMYFEGRTKTRVIRKLTEALAPGGCLILGASEHMPGVKFTSADAARVFTRHAA